MKASIRNLLTAAGSAALLAACAVGPKPVVPTTPVSSQGDFIGSQAGAVSTAPVQGNWWRLYNDANLDALIQQALAENNDLEAPAASPGSAAST